MAAQRILYGALSILLAAGTAVAAPAGTAALEPATITAADGSVVRFERGTLSVRENRAVARSRVIRFGFVRIKATRPTTAPPIFFLPGGPGFSYMDAFGERGENPQRRLDVFRRFAEVADLVVLDQRGFSTWGDKLALPPAPARPLDRPSSVAADARAWAESARAAVAANPGADLSAYHIREFAADVDELRRALGYPTIQLFGGSFGSQWSFAVIRLYPATVARAMLSGVEPLDDNFDVPSQTLAAMQRIAFEADRAPQLQPYRPPGGIMAAARALRDRFARAPVTVRTTDPDTGAAVSVVLGLEDLQAALAVDEAATWPAFVLSLYHGHYEAWARQELASRRGRLWKALINPLVDAGLSGTAARLHRLPTDPGTDLLGTWGFQPHLGSRAAWPTPDAGDALRVPVVSQLPIVFVQGDWDCSTPVENLLDVLPYFPRSRTLIARRGEHATVSYLTTHHPAARAALQTFLATGDASGVPAAIDVPIPAMPAPAFPPPASAAR